MGTFPLLVLTVGLESGDGIHSTLIDLFLNHDDQPPVGCVSGCQRPPRRAACFRLQRIANHRLDVFRRETMFRDVLHITAWFMVPDDIIPRHRASSRWGAEPLLIVPRTPPPSPNGAAVNSHGCQPLGGGWSLCRR